MNKNRKYRKYLKHKYKKVVYKNQDKITKIHVKVSPLFTGSKIKI